MNAEYYISQLQLIPHPEGGFYKETNTSKEWIKQDALPERFTGTRCFSTAIYYLLQKGDFSALHRIKSDECWHFYAGDTLLIHVIETNGNYYITKLGNHLDENEAFQLVVPAGAWFGAEPAENTSFSLVGCTVAPGFDFEDFEMADKKTLLDAYPACARIINRLCR